MVLWRKTIPYQVGYLFYILLLVIFFHCMRIYYLKYISQIPESVYVINGSRRLPPQIPKQEPPHPRKQLDWEMEVRLSDPQLWRFPWKGQIPETTEEEYDFPLAYSILAYREPIQVLLLLRAIYRPHNLYCVHVDVNAPLYIQVTFKRFFYHNPLLPNVFLVDRPVSVRHSTFTTLEADLICMKELLLQSRQEEAWRALPPHRQNKKKPWRYFINLTGQEYPRRTNLELVRMLRDAARGSNLIHKTPLQLDRILKRLWNPPPHGMLLWKGWVHILVCRDFVNFVVNDQRALDLAEYLKDTEVPDESFFSTLNHNPHLKAPGGYAGWEASTMERYQFVNRLKVWSNAPFDPPDFVCHGSYVRLICIYGDDNYPELTREEDPTLFINKFIVEQNGNLLRRIDRWFLMRQQWIYAEPDKRVNISFYQENFIQAPSLQRT